MSAAAPQRDPARFGRVFWAGAALVPLWPLLVATEFKPWRFADAQSLAVTGQFLGSFLPPALAPDFLLMVLRETWRTVAIATAGMTLALLLAHRRRPGAVCSPGCLQRVWKTHRPGRPPRCLPRVSQRLRCSSTQPCRRCCRSR